MRISLRQLQIFAAVAESGSTTAAAELVALSQSAASAGLNELESMLQHKLFDRVGKRLLLNDNGRLLLPQARQMLDAATTIERQFSASDGAAGLRIGASTTIGIYVLPAILAAVSTRATALHPSVNIANTADIAAAVENFDIDMGLVEGPCHQADLLVEPWIKDDLVIVCAPDHPILTGKPGSRISLKALREAGWLLRESGSGTREAVEHALVPHLHTLRAAGEFSNAEAIKHAAAAGLGLACLSLLVVRDMLEAGRLIQLSTALPSLSRHFYLIRNRHKILSTRLEHFLHFCREWKVPSYLSM
ncbi:MAG TPA: LysR family transcriptional regulator [Burkholderiaceae bacterium]|nr:LysR family transcriptional regulator [Burkholderiaceae bacterium]